MSYITKSLVAGETLLFETRHHWIVLLGPVVLSLLLDAAGIACLIGYAMSKNDRAPQFVSSVPPSVLLILGLAALGISCAVLGYGVVKRNATEMGVTNRRVLIKTGIGSRRTLDMMLSKVESIGVTETLWGRTLGYGDVMIHGTGGATEPFVMIAHPQEFRQVVQGQIGK
jgi:uncharacterized membrane protein YdbT with pleckstrin-like domain